MNLWLEAREIGFIFFYTMLGSLMLFWVIAKLREKSFEAGYWAGRATGWQMHRRLTQIQNDVDEVFNYDDYK